MLYVIRGQCNFELREYDHALKDYTKSVTLNPNKITPWLKISVIRSSSPDQKLRDSKQALAAADRACKEFQAAYDKGQKDPSQIFRLKDAIELAPVRRECADALASAHAEAGDYKEAISILKREDENRVKDMIEQYRNSKPNRLPEKDK